MNQGNQIEGIENVTPEMVPETVEDNAPTNLPEQKPQKMQKRETATDITTKLLNSIEGAIKGTEYFDDWIKSKKGQAFIGFKTYYADKLPRNTNDRNNYVRAVVRGMVSCLSAELQVYQKHFYAVPYGTEGNKDYAVIWSYQSLEAIALKHPHVGGVSHRIIRNKDGTMILDIEGVILDKNQVVIHSYTLPKDNFEEMKQKYGKLKNSFWENESITMWIKTARKRACEAFARCPNGTMLMDEFIHTDYKAKQPVNNDEAI